MVVVKYSPKSIFLSVGLLILWFAFSLTYLFYYQEEKRFTSERANYYKEELASTLGRYRYLPYALAGDPIYHSTLTEGSGARLNNRLKDLAGRSGTDAIYLMDAGGLTIASSNADETPTFLGQNYGFRPYFKDALAKGAGEFFAIGATTSIPGYFFSQRVTSPEGISHGVLAIKISLEPLKRIWKELDENVFVTDRNGVIILSSIDAWNYRSTRPLDNARLSEIQEQRQFGAAPLEPLQFQIIENQKFRIENYRYVGASRELNLPEWTLHYVTANGTVFTRAIRSFFLFATPLVLLVTGYFAFSSVQTKKRLIQSQRDGAQMRKINRKLEQEINERRDAEKRLATAQKSLEQISRLAALGEISASVTHELGQPISALQNYVASSELPGSDLGRDGTELMQKIKHVLKRVNHITSQLRFFSTSGENNMVSFDLMELVRNMINLQFFDLGISNHSLNTELSREQILVKGNKLRLEQVFINLIRNAQQATASLDNPRITIRVYSHKSMAVTTVSDNGPGIDKSVRNQIFEPFYTTKASGEGMGLGLVISSAIIAEHDGSIQVTKSNMGGSEFVVRLPLTET